MNSQAMLTVVYVWSEPFYIWNLNWNSKLDVGYTWGFVWTFSLDYGDISDVTKHLYMCVHLLNGLTYLDHHAVLIYL